MAYQALYRVYRPRTFDDMVGQEVITQTLKNAIETHQTGHAYLFSGPRGTGKTSAAKIFAREVNGIDSQTEDAQIPDIIEFDAASNSRVEDMRDILANVDYAPIESEFKIYIIDEVHMLSNSAFNALLKTLEEPPANVKFILATTEPQKVPVTILSRTQRFEFKRIDNYVIQNRLASILQQEKIDFDQDALRIVANVAEGGMRDALSILDQIIAFDHHRVTIDNALQVTGSTTTEQLMRYVTHVTLGKVADALQTLHDILISGKDAQRFVVDVMSLLRDVMLSDVAPDLVKTTAALDDLQALHQQLSDERLQYMMVALDDIQKQLLQTMQSDVYLELLTVKLGMVEGAVHENKNSTPKLDVKKRIQHVESNVPNNEAVTDNAEATIVHPIEEEHKQISVDESEPVALENEDNASTHESFVRTGQSAVFAILQSAKRDALSHVKNNWTTILTHFDVAHQALLTIAEPVAASDEGIVLAFDYPALLVQALDDVMLQSKLVDMLREQNLPQELVMISQDEWQQERATYVTQLKAGTVQQVKLSDLPYHQVSTTMNQESSSNDSSHLNEPSIVSEAKKIFGDDLVTIVD